LELNEPETTRTVIYCKKIGTPFFAVTTRFSAFPWGKICIQQEQRIYCKTDFLTFTTQTPQHIKLER
jgi:hypothetical protein